MSMPIGVGVVIDDQIDLEPDGIDDIVQQLENEGFPLVRYKQLPQDKTIDQFGSVAFLLLDWNLANPSNDDVMNGVQTGSALQLSKTEDMLSFIEKFHKTCFAPVFIFTNENTDVIMKHLVERHLCDGGRHDFILLKQKSDLTQTQNRIDMVVRTVSSWFESTPVLQMLSEWNRGLFSAQSRMFNDFYQGSHSWPTVMAASFADDDSDLTQEMRQVLFRNLSGRMNDVDFGFLAQTEQTPESFPHESVISVFEKMTIIPEDCLAKQFGCGDLFLLDDGDTPLYKVNIRCDCDFLHSKKAELFLLNGREVSGADLATAFDPEQGFKRDIHSAFLFPVNGGKCVRFQFKDFKRVKIADFKATRIGRLQPPYITDIRQRHAQWIQREGFARIPKEVIDHIVACSNACHVEV